MGWGMARRVALFVTCLVDLYRPSVGFAALDLLEAAGCEVVVPEAQTCCGQPAFNSGDRQTAKDLARAMIEVFEPFDAVVVPSGSCGGMIHAHYPELFADDPTMAPRAQALAAKTFELVSFLVDQCGLTVAPAASMAGNTEKPARTVTYHDSCSGLRELGIKQQPRTLVQSIPGVELRELRDAEVCCGFGGTFCVKYPDISNRMVTNKVEAIGETGADLLLAGDLGCLLNMAGKLKREGSAVQVRHVAEFLAGHTDTPAIGEPGPAR